MCDLRPLVLPDQRPFSAFFPMHALTLKNRHSATWPAVIYLLIAVAVGLLLARLPVVWGVALVGGTAVFLLTLIQPLVGLGLVLLLGPFGALESVLFGWGLDSGQLLLLFTLAAWLARGLARRRIVVPRTFLNVPLGLFLLLMALTVPGALSVTVGLRELAKWLEIGLLVLLVADLAQEFGGGRYGRYVPWLLAGMLLLSGVVQAVIGIWQFGLRGDGPEHFLVLGRFYRAAGTFEQPNPYGGFMNLSVLLAGGIFLGGLAAVWQKRREAGFSLRAPRAWGPLLLIGAVAVITGLGLVFSWSRGAWLGFAAGTAVLLFFWPRRRRWGTAVLLGGGLLFLLGLQLNLVPPSVTDRLVGFGQDLQFGDVRGVDINDANYAVLERLAHWQAALDMAREHLWWGVGFGNYEPAYASYALVNWPDALGHAHNYYINLLAEVGVIGLLAYLGFWLVVVWQTWRLLAVLEGSERGLALGLLAVWVALAVHHLVDKLYVNNIYVHLGVMFGLLAVLRWQADGRAKVQNSVVEA
ncbi:MAG: O-antigen ligase family protein [Anaerolineales bacterium]|nr:O-antigen ligase family protein [Anaerolineales bacterium]